MENQKTASEKLWRSATAFFVLAVAVWGGCGPVDTSKPAVAKPTETPETMTIGELAVDQEIEAVVCPILVPSGTNIRKSPEVITPKIEGTSNLILEVPEGQELVIHGGRVAREQASMIQLGG